MLIILSLNASLRVSGLLMLDSLRHRIRVLELTPIGGIARSLRSCLQEDRKVRTVRGVEILDSRCALGVLIASLMQPHEFRWWLPNLLLFFQCFESLQFALLRYT